MATVEIESLPSPPTDGVTRLSYLPATSTSSSLLASSSWDGSVRIHDTLAKAAVLSHVMDAGPLLSLATPAGATSVVTGGLDGSIRSFDIAKSTYQVLGRHTGDDRPENSVVEGTNMACSCLGVLNDMVPGGGGLIASAGWDGRFHVWDARQSKAASTLKLPGKAFSLDVDQHHSRVVVATSGRRLCFIDVRKPEPDSTDLATLALDRESSLKYQTRTVRYFPDGTGIALGSIEGRVAVEYMEELGIPSQRKAYAFKCHRKQDVVFPVNCIDFHPRFGTFATGGCDGTVVVWDGFNKKKLTSLPPFATSIAALAFNHDGTELAIASSYTFEEGEREHPRDEIFVRPMADVECLPKTMKD